MENKERVIKTMNYVKNIIEQIVDGEFSGQIKNLTPDGTEPQALISQWMHCLAAGIEDRFFPSGTLTKEKAANLITKSGILGDLTGIINNFRCSIHIPPVQTAFTFADLFAGIGGMRIGFQNAGGHCVFSSEFEKNAQRTYFDNYAEYPFGDITKIKAEQIPDHDVLLAGFPCQPFSHAGRKLGIEDTRGTLFYDIARILEVKKPKVALLENVKGLISHDNGNTLQIILDSLTGIGYKCIIDENTIRNADIVLLKEKAKQMVLTSRDFGVPQNRQRIYIVLWRDDINKEFIYPIAPKTETILKSILEQEPEAKYTISDRLFRGHKRRKNLHIKKGNGFGYSLFNSESRYTNTLSARYYKDGSEILIEQQGKNPRKITPREASRLQGFPENFIINPSEVQAYKQFGNSVTVAVIEALAKEIKKQLLSD